jgi:DNA gyrase/topoisomerase IV subunit A
MFLFEARIVSLQVSTGTFFKTVNKDFIVLSAKDVVTQVIGKRANKGYGALGSSFVAADLSSTDEVMAILSGNAPPAMATSDSPLPAPSPQPVTASLPVPSETMAAAPTPTPTPAVTALTSAPVVVNLEAQRLQALADQRAQELTQLRQQLAQAETQRLQDAQRLAEISAAEQKRQADVLQQQIQAQQRSQELQRPQRIEPAPPSGKRKALVIGNDLYRHVTQLDNARADARAMSQSLQTLGFNVTLALDQTERGLKETLRNFKSSVEGGDEVVVFYAGHGVQIGTTNYLLPVDIAGQNEDQVRDEAIQMQRILDDMQERRTGFLLMIVDACRDNPFKVAGRTLGGRGLAPTTAATGQMVIFSAGTGQQALDKLGADDKEPNG